MEDGCYAATPLLCGPGRPTQSQRQLGDAGEKLPSTAVRSPKATHSHFLTLIVVMMWLSSLQLRESYTKNGVPEYHYALFFKKKKGIETMSGIHHGNSRVKKPLRMWSYELRHTDDVLHTEMDQKLHRICWSTPSITLEERIATQASDTDVSRSLVQNSQMLQATPKPIPLLNGQTAHICTWTATQHTQQQATNKKTPGAKRADTRSLVL